MWSSLSLLYSRSTLGFGSLGGHTQKNHTHTHNYTQWFTHCSLIKQPSNISLQMRNSYATVHLSRVNKILMRSEKQAVRIHMQLFVEIMWLRSGQINQPLSKSCLRSCLAS